MSLMDDVLVALNSITGVKFVRDVWMKQPTSDYGTVQLTDQRIMWADNLPHRRRQTFAVDLYTYGQKDTLADTVLQKLAAVKKVRNVMPGVVDYLDADGLMHYGWTVTAEEVMQCG